MATQRIIKSCKYPIAKVTIDSNTMEPVIRDSTEGFGLNLGKNTIPPTIAHIPNDPNSSPNPVDSSPNSYLAKNGKRDSNALLNKVNTPARTINTRAA
jgi:hypothetical protein